MIEDLRWLEEEYFTVVHEKDCYGCKGRNVKKTRRTLQYRTDSMIEGAWEDVPVVKSK
ncbi:hypothetical protein KAR91_47900 [Candidatus Pacearchaeota archaeon]|nr:hypothetical protein [Candidatus Pacearchaeota archaeon]